MAERDHDGDSDVVVWAEAARATIASHRRDLATLMPWAPGLETALTTLDRCPRGPPGDGGPPGLAPTPAIWRIAARSPWASWSASALPGPRRRGTRGPASRASIGSSRDSNAPPRPPASSPAACWPVARITRELFDAMQFGFLFDPMRKIFSIGYRITDGSLDPGDYDLLASEARLASFIAIAKGDVPASHWFRLGRPMTPVGTGRRSISWSGSMFEYLMPALVMRSPPGSLLDQTYRLVVHRQIELWRGAGSPLGDFGIRLQRAGSRSDLSVLEFRRSRPGLKRGLGEDLVIAPYATALAAMVDPSAAAAQFSRARRGGRARSPMGSTRRSTTRRRGFRRADRWPSCAHTWPTTRG